MEMIKPKKLKYGDTIAITAPAMYNFSNEQVVRGLQTLKDMGFQVIVGASVKGKYLNTTGTKAFRAQELESFFLNDKVKAIVCLCGGDSAYELIESINYEVVKTHPKIFSGMSDITHLHLPFFSMTGLSSLYCMDLIWGFGVEDSKEKKYNIELFKNCCMESKPIGKLPKLYNWEVWREGKAKGVLLGGWIGAIFSLANTKYYPVVSDCIWFTELVSIEPHELRRHLTVMEANGFFENVRGIVVGKMIDCEEKTYQGEMESIKEIFINVTEKYDLPIIANADFGHGETYMPLPEGLLARIDTSDISIEIMESFVGED